jgi:hypothetical protein
MAPLEEGIEQNNASVRLVEPNDLAPQGSHRQWSNRNAYNETRVEEAKALPGLGMPGVLMRWTEHVNDMTRQPLDKRVGKDSIALHGQLRLQERLLTEGLPGHGGHRRRAGGVRTP